MLNSCLDSEPLTLDEILGKAGRKSKGKMQTGYFWSFYGDRDEVAFIYSVSCSCDVVEPYLKDFEGVLVTDGYSGYESLCKKLANQPCPVLDKKPAMLCQIREGRA